MNQYHRLLKRQLKKAGLTQEILDRIKPLLNQVNQAYLEYNADLKHLEHTLEKSSQELYVINKKLKQNVEQITGKLERVVGNIQEVIFETDLEGNWTYLNPAWEKLTGLKVADCLGKPFSDYLGNISEKDQKILTELKELNFNGLHQTFEIINQSKDKKWLDISLKLVHDINNNPTGCIGTIVDITPLKNIEFALIEAKDKETEANKAKDEFLSTMSHEIRTPLNAVIGISHLLLLENPREDQLENMNSLKYSSEHLLGLVNDILDFNKIESGNIDLENTDFSLQHIINGLQSSFVQKAEEKNIRFVIKKDDQIPDILLGDPMRISQILTNLVNNAVKFTEQGKVVLDIEQSNRSNSEITIRFSVIDTGIGIDQSKHEKIFESFAQASSNTTRKFGGTGLGLAICKKLLLLMSSELHLESELGKGSTFSFNLSLKVSEKFDEPKANYTNTMPSFEGLEGMKVLVAEDHRMNIMVIKKFFTKWDIEFDIAENGQIAVDMAQDKFYDLILMDLQMPIMSGYEASLQIRKSNNAHNKIIPIYALSASAGVAIKTKVLSYGMDGHISKPFNPSDLYQKLKRIKNRLT